MTRRLLHRTNSQSHDVGNIPNQSSASDLNQSVPLTMDVSSDDETPGNESSKTSCSMRSVVFQYFVEEDKGYRCKLCKEVSGAFMFGPETCEDLEVVLLSTLDHFSDSLFPQIIRMSTLLVWENSSIIAEDFFTYL